MSSEGGMGGSGERAEVCEKLVSEVNKSICHNQFRCKIPSLLGQISLFLFQREGEQKKKQQKDEESFRSSTTRYASENHMEIVLPDKREMY